MNQVDWSPGGIRHHLDIDNDDGAMIVRRIQDCEPILEYNKFLRSLGPQHYKGEDGNLWHYARVPNIILEEWIHKYGPDVVLNDTDNDFIIKLIEREYPYLKVGDFRLA